MISTGYDDSHPAWLTAQKRFYSLRPRQVINPGPVVEEYRGYTVRT